jgi:hypothetical protein
MQLVTLFGCDKCCLSKLILTKPGASFNLPDENAKYFKVGIKAPIFAESGLGKKYRTCGG